MEIDEHLKYTLLVSTFPHRVTRLLTNPSLQFDPCPRAGEPMVSRRMSRPLTKIAYADYRQAHRITSFKRLRDDQDSTKIAAAVERPGLPPKSDDDRVCMVKALRLTISESLILSDPSNVLVYIFGSIPACVCLLSVCCHIFSCAVLVLSLTIEL